MKRISTMLLICLALTTSVMQQASGAEKISDKELLNKVKAYDAYTRDVRRHLHYYPETGGQEVQTVRYLKEKLAEIGQFDIHDVPGSTGFYAILDTHRPGKTIGLRTDIDGLPVTESPVNGEGKAKPFVSKNPGFTQGCGHDGHMAMLLTTIRILYDWRTRLNGKSVFHSFRCHLRQSSGIKRAERTALHQGRPHFGRNGVLSWQVFGRGGHASRPDLSVKMKNEE